MLVHFPPANQPASHPKWYKKIDAHRKEGSVLRRSRGSSYRFIGAYLSPSIPKIRVNRDDTLLNMRLINTFYATLYNNIIY